MFIMAKTNYLAAFLLAIDGQCYARGLQLIYRQTSDKKRTLVGNEIIDHSDVIGASPDGGAPTTFSFST